MMFSHDGESIPNPRGLLQRHKVLWQQVLQDRIRLCVTSCESACLKDGNAIKQKKGVQIQCSAQSSPKTELNSLNRLNVCNFVALLLHNLGLLHPHYFF